MEWRKRLGNKGIDTKGKRALAALLLHVVFKPAGQVNNGVHIFIGFKGQTDHNVEAEVTYPGLQPHIHGAEEMFFLNALVDNGTHTGAASLRCHRQGFQTALCQRVHQFPGDRIGPERGYRHG